ncbi:unnamed protein product [Adineta steineri]|uniref:F-box domain-containing protein n=1 Tax=Adineta steineri TaxID=433720 RepID=A0A814MLL9_9BILA|nr:unnamed protein product [Adineta steineri]CAF3483051.1 unnamed protein product [Adineta steineri]
MSDNLVQHYINTHEYLTIKIYDCYLLFHRNIIQHSNNHELGLELPPAIVETIFGSNPLSVIDVTSTCHVHPSLYDIIIFADKSAVYTRKKLSSKINKAVKQTTKYKILPYYVHEDLELLKYCGMSKEDIDLFRKKLDDNQKLDFFTTSKSDEILQKIINFTDISTRLNCRLVSRKWKTLVDRSSSWNYVCLTKLNRYVNRALSYFQKINIRELDLSQLLFEPLQYNITSDLSLYSLRSLCITTDHPPELFILLFQIAPFLQHIKLIQTVNSSLKIKTNQLYDYINYIICLCQNNLKYLRKLHIQLRSAFDQIFLESSSVTSIPVSYEVITC